MPTYEYECQKCGHEFEREQRITDDPVKMCPRCRAKRVRRLISLTSFVLKGGGWYADSYSRRSDSQSDKDGKPGEASSESGSGGSESDAKPDTKPDEKTKTKSKGKGKKAAA